MDISRQFIFKVDKAAYILSIKGHVSRFILSLFSGSKEAEFAVQRLSSAWSNSLSWEIRSEWTVMKSREGEIPIQRAMFQLILSIPFQ